MRARLTIKGDRFQAAKAAADRGFGFAFEREIPMEHTGYRTIGTTDWTVERLNAWFTEHTDPPFQSGTLLLWTPIGE